MTSEVFNEDCRTGMGRFPDGYFDLAIVDPPYYSGPERRRSYGSAVGFRGVHRRIYGKTDKWSVPGPEYFDELKRVSKNQIIWGCNYYQYQFGPGRIIWDKCNGDTTFSDCEEAYCSLHDSIRLFRYMWNGMMQGKSITEGHLQRGDKSKNQARIHPTEKPIELYCWLLQKYAKPGFKILDTHLGSGSHRRAAFDLGFDFTAFEIDPTHYNNQEEAFKRHVGRVKASPKLFETAIQLSL